MTAVDCSHPSRIRELVLQCLSSKIHLFCVLVAAFPIVSFYEILSERYRRYSIPGGVCGWPRRGLCDQI